MASAQDLSGGRLSLLRCVGVNLLVDQLDVKGVAPALDAVPPGPGEIAGVVRHAGRQWPLYFLDDAFRPQTKPQTEFRFCVCLQGLAAESAFALACESFELVDDEHGEYVPIPDCMTTSSLPFDATRTIGDQAGLHLNLDSLFRYLQNVQAEAM